jgi:hypothetical protein
MFKETIYGDRTFDPAQLEQMNGALFNLLTYCNDVPKLKRYLLEVKTAFFQPYEELAALVRQKLDNEHGARPYGWERFKTQTDTMQFRLTHKYRDGYSYLDEYEDAARLELIACEMSRDNEDGCDETSRQTYVYRLISVEDGYKNKLKRMFYSHLGGSSCTHDYDCCGCWTYRVNSVRRIHLGNVVLYKVEVNGSRNY